MRKYKEMTRDELLTLKAALQEKYKEEQAKGLNLNMARGKPGFSQLALSMGMLDEINSSSDMRTLLGNDTRNYGDLDGIGECRAGLAVTLVLAENGINFFFLGAGELFGLFGFAGCFDLRHCKSSLI